MYNMQMTSYVLWSPLNVKWIFVFDWVCNC